MAGQAPVGTTTTSITTTAPQEAYTATTKTTSIQYTGESSQRYVPLGTQPVMAYPHNVRCMYDPNLVPAFVAPPRISVSPGYTPNWPNQPMNQPVELNNRPNMVPGAPRY
ncbi:hypothetical protein GNI_140740 [Gregarina niphandrodes]|uniref:Uncharacterized protein n=1 Tax=Gregarina niphandrodes TaxID=110365 RepID=A0A023B099_GRENI|nr:hypothetical protein GNI_140740 [Gregarina niphandrodes]EZG45098.1 hypothetical protein GNI_140740 [Gregarina niphandrodes]|eukprot:XP_011132561.1 hypothetical protein GNI_140740 [Gregarina niphandrodes]